MNKAQQMELMTLEFLMDNPGATVVHVSASSAQAKAVLKGSVRAHADAAWYTPLMERLIRDR